jgi:hypothetical protein
VRTIALVIGLMILSGLGDAIGFVHAARVWQGGRPVWCEFLQSSAGFLVGVGAYWLSLRYLNHYGSFAPEMQALLWFAITIVGIAVVSRAFFTWHISEQLVALSLVGCVGWLLVRTSS